MDTWQYRDSTWTQGSDFSGDEVEATDGSIGRVDASTTDVSASYVVVDSDAWGEESRGAHQDYYSPHSQ